jgi:TadE-like protein
MRIPTMFRSKRGSAAVEFALLSIVLLLFLSTVVDWGWYMTQRVSVARATMDGTRVGAATFESSLVADGSLTVPAAEARTVEVLEDLGLPCIPPSCSVDVTHCSVGEGGVCMNPPFEAIHVALQYEYVPFFGFIPTPTVLHSEFIMATEAQP